MASVSNTEGDEYVVEQILYKGIYKRKNYYLVQWMGYDLTQTTWEPESNMESCKELVEIFDEAFEYNNLEVQKLTASDVSNPQIATQHNNILVNRDAMTAQLWRMYNDAFRAGQRRAAAASAGPQMEDVCQATVDGSTDEPPVVAVYPAADVAEPPLSEIPAAAVEEPPLSEIPAADVAEPPLSEIPAAAVEEPPVLAVIPAAPTDEPLAAAVILAVDVAKPRGNRFCYYCHDKTHIKKDFPKLYTHDFGRPGSCRRSRSRSSSRYRVRDHSRRRSRSRSRRGSRRRSRSRSSSRSRVRDHSRRRSRSRSRRSRSQIRGNSKSRSKSRVDDSKRHDSRRAITSRGRQDTGSLSCHRDKMKTDERRKTSENCPKPSNRERGGVEGKSGVRNTSFKCDEEGHMSRHCPNGGSRSRSSTALADYDWETSSATSSPWATGANSARRGRATPSAGKSNDDDWGALAPPRGCNRSTPSASNEFSIVEINRKFVKSHGKHFFAP